VFGVLAMRVAVVQVVQVVAVLLAGVAAARAVHVLVLGVRRSFVHVAPSTQSACQCVAQPVAPRR
jgi:hypothetical protein